MRCSYHCCGESFDLNQIKELCLQLGYQCRLYDPEVLHVTLSHNEENKDIYVFSYGCITFWGFDELTEQEVIDNFSIYLNEKLTNIISDSCKYQINEEEPSTIDEETDVISLETDDVLIKLSLSYGLSQSVKLIYFENSVDTTIESTRHIPDELIKTGKISMSRSMVARKIGELFAERNSVNLHSTILDIPEFFWRRPKYQAYYEMSVEFMDIRTRLKILNTRLEVVHELYEILSNELQHIQSSRLELIIIYLIFFEVVITIFRDILKWI
jgi:uncharacterized Rmd1/YagE family protein